MSRLPSRNVMIRALLERDRSFEGLFFAGVTTTGIFCRPTCGARKPRPENVAFYATASEALHAGFRPCRICRPLESERRPPAGVRRLLALVETHPDGRVTDKELAARGFDPSTARRRFRAHYGMTFQAYQRARRVGSALRDLAAGSSVGKASRARGFATPGGLRKAVARLLGPAPLRGAAGVVLLARRFPTPLGEMLALAGDDGLCLLEFVDRRGLERELLDLRRRSRAAVVPGDNAALRAVGRQLREYFRGERGDFDVPLSIHGSPFERSVWEALRAIPPGETRSYAEIAAEVGQPRAVRAVGRANGRNRIALAIPCHRVIRSDGTLSGYGGGVWRKQRLLEHERAMRERRRSDGIAGRSARSRAPLAIAARARASA